MLALNCRRNRLLAGLVLACSSAIGTAAVILSPHDGNVDSTYASANGGRGMAQLPFIDGLSDQVKSILLNPDHSLLLIGEGVNQSQPVTGLLNIDASGAPVRGKFCNGRTVACTLTTGYSTVGGFVPGAGSSYAQQLIVNGQHPTSNSTTNVGITDVEPTYNGIATTLSGNAFTPPHTSTNTFITAAGKQSDDKFIYVGYSTGSTGNSVIFVSRYIDDTPDPNFGNGGTTLIAPTVFPINGNYIYQANAFAIAPDGKILVVGTITGNTLEYNTVVGVFRLNTDGSLDTTFGSNGRVGLDFLGRALPQQRSVGNAIALRDDGSIIVAGAIYVPVQTGNTTEQQYAAFARLHADGSFGDAFGAHNTRGFTDNSYAHTAASSVIFHYTASDGDLTDTVNAISIQPNGRILLAGYAAFGRSGYIGVSRLERNGDPDLTFGPLTTGSQESTRIYSYLCGSVVTACAHIPADFANAIVSDSAGIYVAGGARDATGAEEFSYMRLINNDLIFANNFSVLPPGG